MLGKLSIIGAVVAAIIMIPTALFAQMGGAVNPSVHVGGAGATVRGAVERRDERATASAINATAPSLHRKDIDRAALRHLGILAGEQQIHARLHLGRVDAPTGLHRDVLLVVYLERHRHRRNPRDGRELPEDFS